MISRRHSVRKRPLNLSFIFLKRPHLYGTPAMSSGKTLSLREERENGHAIYEKPVRFLKFFFDTSADATGQRNSYCVLHCCCNVVCKINTFCNSAVV